MSESTVQLIVAVLTLIGVLVSNHKSNRIHVLVNSNLDRVKQELADAKVLIASLVAAAKPAADSARISKSSMHIHNARSNSKS